MFPLQSRNTREFKMPTRKNGYRLFGWKLVFVLL
jgi:hypothetical protein